MQIIIYWLIASLIFTAGFITCALLSANGREREHPFEDDDIGDINYPDDWEEEEYADIYEKEYEYQESKELMKELRGNNND